MSILFRCPCGRSMVVESDRAGAVVNCPNCKRSLKVPSGKDRGVELAPVPAAAKTRTSRTCPRCQKDIPVDVQMCPHCKAIVMDAAAPATAAAAAAVSAAPRPGTSTRSAGAAKPGMRPAIRYGGHNASWWEQLTSQQKGMVIGGFGGGGVLLLVIALVIYVVYGNSLLRDDRESARKDLDQGHIMELNGKFQGAHDLYAVFSRIEDLKVSGEKGNSDDGALAKALVDRVNAMAFLAPSTQIGRDESIYWKPKSPSELEEGRANLRADYGNYKTQALGITSLIQTSTKAAETTPDKAAYAAKVTAVMDAYVRLVATTSKYDHASITFQQLLESIRNYTNAYKDWDTPDRARLVKSAFMYADACRERMEMTEFGDNIWER